MSIEQANAELLRLAEAQLRTLKFHRAYFTGDGIPQDIADGFSAQVDRAEQIIARAKSATRTPPADSLCVCGHTFAQHDQAWNSGFNCTVCGCNVFEKAEPTSDYSRFLAWLKDERRKPAALAFTSGALRDAATAAEAYFASHWRDDDSPISESTFGVHVPPQQGEMNK